jgi:hypothetical protein
MLKYSYTRKSDGDYVYSYAHVKINSDSATHGWFHGELCSEILHT